jgi:hypothetical protein
MKEIQAQFSFSQFSQLQVKRGCHSRLSPAVRKVRCDVGKFE